MLCNLVFIGFALFDMKKYLFCRVLPHMNQQKTSGNETRILLLTLGRCENNGKLKLSSTNKRRVHSLLLTFNVCTKAVTEINSICVCNISYFDSFKS